MNGDEDSTDPRNPQKSTHVSEAIEFYSLRVKYRNLKNSLSEVETSLNERLGSVEKEVSGYRRKFNFVKGGMYGFLLAIVSGAWVALDKLEGLLKAVGLFK